MSEDMDSKGIYFDLQWKTKSGSSNAEEFGSIGIWEVDNSSLNWFTFKPYLCQTLGNVENVSISYVDSDGDEIPIDSDLEFQEALKFARRKAAMRQKIVLKVEKLDNQAAATGGAEASPPNPLYMKSSNFFKERLKMNCNVEEQDLPYVSAVEGPVKTGNSSCKVKTKPKSKDVLCPLQSCESPPLWFKKYMKKMKSEIICEVTANVNNQIKKALDEMGQKGQPMIFPTGPMNSNGKAVVNGKSSAWLVTKTKKKTSDDDSSDGAHKIEIKDSKILKKIEKLHRREKKLDHKKEKLEQKTKKIAERKEKEYLSKLRLEIAGCNTSHIETTTYSKLREPEVTSVPRQKVNACESIQNKVPPRALENASMGVSVNGDDMRTMSVKRGSNFTKIWKVINSGDAPWTDETEVKLSWGNAGLNPELLSVKCPPLAPGEGGEIAVKFSSPNFPGLFESHWHFYHKNIRFGSRMSCIVSVDLIKNEEEPKSEPRKQNLSSASSAEFIVVPSTSVSVDGCNANAEYEGIQKDSANISEAAPSVSMNPDETLGKLDSFSSASGPKIEDKKFKSEEDCACIGEKEALFESISTDDLSGSDASLASDSDENFVVVPMPPCFRFDVPLNSGGPSAVKTDTLELMEHVDVPEHPLINKTPESPKHLPSAPSAPLDDRDAQTPDFSHMIEMPLQREVSDDTGEVISVPLKPLQPKPNVSTPQFQPAVKQISPKRQSPKPHHIGWNEPFSNPATTQHASSSTSANPSSDSDQSSTSSSSARANTSRSQEDPSKGKGGGAEQSHNIPHARTTPRSSPNRSRPIDFKPRSMTEVINGALSVTSSALNTAFAALDSILETTGSSVTPGTVYSEPPIRPPQRSKSTANEDPPSPPIDPEMANGLTKLANMGFVDLELNQALLRVYNHNLPEVVEALLNRGS